MGSAVKDHVGVIILAIFIVFAVFGPVYVTASRPGFWMRPRMLNHSAAKPKRNLANATGVVTEHAFSTRGGASTRNSIRRPRRSGKPEANSAPWRTADGTPRRV